MLAAFLNDRKTQGIERTYLQGDDNFGGSPPSWAKDSAVTISAALETMRPIFDSPTERVNKALLKLARLLPKPGTKLQLVHPAELYSEDTDDLYFILSSLRDRGLAKVSMVNSVVESPIQLTFDGWARVEDLRKEARGLDSTQGFVAMSFDPSMDEAYAKGLKPAIEAAGYDARMVKTSTAPIPITDEILAEIRKSRFLVADFTGQKGGVYFEAGFAMGLGIPVIWTVKKEEIEKLHFDIRQYRHIDWVDYDDLRERLRVTIEAHVPNVRRAK
jgi:nucleoside 2-deoxyribosyltransferase